MTADDRRPHQFWEHTKNVCHNENATAWRHYGGRVADLTRRLSRAERDLRDRISHTDERIAQLDRLLGEEES